MKRHTLLLVALLPLVGAASNIAGTVDRSCFGPLALMDDGASCPNGWRRGLALDESRFDSTVCWQIEDGQWGKSLVIQTTLGGECRQSALTADWKLGWPELAR